MDASRLYRLNVGHHARGSHCMTKFNRYKFFFEIELPCSDIRIIY